MKSQPVTFPGAFGDDLAARLERPDGEPRVYALFAHCFSCSKDLKAVSRISRALVERGFAVLRFDFTGLGESEGEFADSNFSSNLDDLRAAVDYLRREHQAPQLLIGHSLGGAAVLVMAGDVPECRAVATIAAPSDTAHLRELLLDAAPKLAEAEEAMVELAGRSLRIRRQLLDDLAEERVLPAVGSLDRPLLLLHSPVDEVIDVEHARHLYEAARQPKSFVALAGADHLLLKDPADAQYVAAVLTAWAGRYLEVEPPPGEAAPPEVEDGQVLTSGDRTLRVEIRAGRHALAADEPVHYGGNDSGPNPYDLLLAALGACTSMTLRMYADRKGWPLEGVDIRLEHNHIHAKDCSDCATKEGKLSEIQRAISLRGDLDEAQRVRLLEIANRCPVHRTLTSEIVIRSRLA